MTASPKVAQDPLGYPTIVLALNTFSHILPGIQEEAAERVVRFLGG